jgi:phosphatidylserine decarboxylase
MAALGWGVVTSSSEPVDVRRRAGWLPQNQDDLESWLDGHRQRVEARGDQIVLAPVLVEFQKLVDSDAIVRMHLNEMIAQVPKAKRYRKRHVDSVAELFRLINEVLTMAPEFGDQNVTLPLGAILDWTMGTSAGFAAYRDPRLNEMIRNILAVWSGFLSSSASLYVLNDSPSGWKCEAAREAVGIEQYQHDPQDEHWGFASWNDFFTRRFKDGARPVHSPDDDDVVVSACESTPYAIATDVRLQDSFWIKSQPYSLRDMLANNDACEEFVGGTVYQAFLSATNYHRWHSPVAGTIVSAVVQPGTYYSEADSEGADAVHPVESQGYLAHVATRAIILIQADNAAIGLVGFVAVGMLEVSSCLIDPDMTAGHHVAKGDELGYFQFGGSSHCLIFRPGAVADFHLSAIPQPHDPTAPSYRSARNLLSRPPTCSRDTATQQPPSGKRSPIWGPSK